MIHIATPLVDEASIKAVEDVLRSGILTQGPKVEEFEEAFASSIGTKYAVATNSGTTALHVALLVSGIGPGDEVITTPFSFVATANSILFCGAKPVFVDIDEETFNIAPHLIREKITPRTKAIIAVHLYGQPCDMRRIAQIAEKHGLTVIEDACQAPGAEYEGRKVGSLRTGCFSFYPTKNITTGEGGIITTNDEAIAKKARMTRNQGQRGRYIHEILGYNYRMTETAAALGICQLRKLDEYNQKRGENALFLTKGISKIKGLIPPFVTPGVKHVFHQFTIRVTEDFGIPRDELQRRLKEREIESAVHYGTPIHKQPLYQRLGYNEHLPVSEKAAQEVLSLPVHPSLTLEDLGYIVQTIENISKEKV